MPNAPMFRAPFLRHQQFPFANKKQQMPISVPMCRVGNGEKDKRLIVVRAMLEFSFCSYCDGHAFALHQSFGVGYAYAYDGNKCTDCDTNTFQSLVPEMKRVAPWHGANKSYCQWSGSASRCPAAAPKIVFSWTRFATHRLRAHLNSILTLCQHPAQDKSRFVSIRCDSRHPSAGHLFSFYSGVG